MAEITHVYVPKHVKLKQEEAEELLKRYNITTKQLPQISKKDAAIKEMDVKKGDIIKIIRNSPTNGEAIFYRIVQ